MKFKSFLTKKGETAAQAEEAEGSTSAHLDEVPEEEDAPRERKMPPKYVEEQAPPAPEQPVAPEPPQPEYKFGIADRLSRAVEASPEVDAVKRSPDLVPLSKQFEDMRKRLRQTITTAKRYHASISALDQDRMQMAKELAHFAENSPIAGQVSDTESTNGGNPSLLSIYHQVSHQVSKFNDKQERDILDYCVEWEAVVTARVDADQASVKELRSNYNHYQAKVDALRKKVNGIETKGKAVKDDLMEKLERNESKLEEASADFEAAAAPLCCLLEEIVNRAWKDLVPLLQSVAVWEADRSHKEAKIFQQLRGLEFVEHQSSGGRKEKKPSKSSLSHSHFSSSPSKKRSSSKKVAHFNPEQLSAVATASSSDASDDAEAPKGGEESAAPRKSDSV